ncbi:ceramidase [Xylariaceae sp. FL0804]|nr:ceramidase [Xylariaceae sp. FL0804]
MTTTNDHGYSSCLWRLLVHQPCLLLATEDRQFSSGNLHDSLHMGHHNRHFGGDRHALSGAWSPPTSSANFCEEDYAMTIYLAEFINTLTNLAYVYFALKYMYGPGSRGILAPKTDFMSISLLVLGIASFLFHATLRQNLQFADDLGMLGLVWAIVRGLFTSSEYARLVNITMAIVFPLFAAFYVWSGKIIYHLTAFTIIIALIILRGHYLFLWRSPGFPETKGAGWRSRARRALAFMAVGYILWNVDLELCAKLRALRGQVGLPWAWLLEMHGWWHILTAISAARWMDIVREVQEELKAEEKIKQ